MMKRLLLLGLLLISIPLATAELSNYPDQFIKDDNFEGLIVVGKNAPSQDVASAIEIIPSLQALSTERISGSTLDTDVNDYDIKSNNIISIGCENTVTEQITGLTCDDFTPTKGYIYLYENKYGKTHIIVAGGTTDDTEMAAMVLGNYKNKDLEGNAVRVDSPDSLVQITLPNGTEGIEITEEEDVEEELRKIKEKIKKEVEETQKEENTSDRAKELEEKIERLNEKEEVQEPKEEPVEEQPKYVAEPNAPLYEKVWVKFRNWLSWFFE